MDKIIKNYAHDYRDMKLSEIELENMLNSFLEESNLIQSMRKLNEVLYITEEPHNNKWYLSFKKPQFQGGDSVEISKEEAIKLLKVID